MVTSSIPRRNKTIWTWKSRLQNEERAEVNEMLEEELAMSTGRGDTAKKHAREMEKLAEEDSFIIQNLLNETAIKVAPQNGLESAINSHNLVLEFNGPNMYLPAVSCPNLDQVVLN